MEISMVVCGRFPPGSRVELLRAPYPRALRAPDDAPVLAQAIVPDNGEVGFPVPGPAGALWFVRGVAERRPLEIRVRAVDAEGRAPVVAPPIVVPQGRV
jgi:hypothetical protein